MLEASDETAAPTREASCRTRLVSQMGEAASPASRGTPPARAFQYRLRIAVLPKPRRVAEMAFIGVRVRAFAPWSVWHGGPEEGTWCWHNAEIMRAAHLASPLRGPDTNVVLVNEGWEAVRVWARGASEISAVRVEVAVPSRRPSQEPI